MTSLKRKSISAVSSIVVLAWMLFLYFKILEHIQATELMWFLYWVYVPLSVVVVLIAKFIGEEVE